MKTRVIAAVLHFVISFIVISIALSVIYFVWYPKPFYIIHSVFDAVKVAVIVDLVLGPFLTFVVFNLSKPRAELIRDLSVIVLFQVIALSWGLHITHKMRPDFFVFQGNTFYSIIQEEINTDRLNENVSPPALWENPKAIYIEPLSSVEAVVRMKAIVQGGEIIGEMYQTERYKPLSMKMNNEYMQDILRRSTSYKVLLRSKTWKPQLEYFLASNGGEGEDYLFYSLENSIQFNGIIIFNKSDFSFAGLME